MGGRKTFWMHHIHMISPINLCEWTNWIQEKYIYLIIIVIVVIVIIIIIIISTAGLRLFIVWTDLFFLLQGCQMLCLLGFAEAPPPNSHTQTQMQWEGLFVGYWLQSKGKQIYKTTLVYLSKKNIIYREGDTQTPRLETNPAQSPENQWTDSYLRQFKTSALKPIHCSLDLGFIKWQVLWSNSCSCSCCSPRKQKILPRQLSPAKAVM